MRLTKKNYTYILRMSSTELLALASILDQFKDSAQDKSTIEIKFINKWFFLNTEKE